MYNVSKGNSVDDVVELIANTLPEFTERLVDNEMVDINIGRLKLLLKYSTIAAAVVVKSDGVVMSYRMFTVCEDIMENILVIEDVYKLQGSGISEAIILYAIDRENDTLDAHFFRI
jgi:hypothetical protein